MAEFDLLLSMLVGLVALLYSSTGHGGASGYLIVMSLTGFGSRAEMTTAALMLNVFVAGTAWRMFHQAGFGSWRLTRSFVLGSVPMALIGGAFHVPPQVYSGFLSIALCAAAVRIGVTLTGSEGPYRAPRLAVALPLGAAIGLLSGLVGVGGGIFLSPLMILRRWANPKTTAGICAAFITVNSLAGLAGKYFTHQLAVDGRLVPLMVAAWTGGLIGSSLGAYVLPKAWVCRATALVLALAPLKWIIR
jgi:uncharacterized membrane protein YfcA